MSPQEQEIIDAIWGEDAHEIDRAVIDGIFAMADLAAERVAHGKFVIVPETDTLH